MDQSITKEISYDNIIIYHTNNTNNLNNSNNKPVILAEQKGLTALFLNEEYIDKLRIEATKKRNQTRPEIEKKWHNYGIALFLSNTKKIEKAKQFLLKSIEKNNVFSMYYLGYIYEINHELELAYHYYSCAINNGIVQMLHIHNIRTNNFYVNYDSIIMKLFNFYYDNRIYFIVDIGQKLIYDILKHGNLVTLKKLLMIMYNIVNIYDIKYIFDIDIGYIIDTITHLIIDNYLDSSVYKILSSIIKYYTKNNTMNDLLMLKKVICYLLLLNKKSNYITVNYNEIYTYNINKINYYYPIEMYLFHKQHSLQLNVIDNNVQFAINRYNTQSIMTECNLCCIKKKCITFLCSCNFRTCLSCYSYYIYRSNMNINKFYNTFNKTCPNCRSIIYIYIKT